MLCIIICVFSWLGHSELKGLIQSWRIKGIERGVRYWTRSKETRLLIIAYRDGEKGRKDKTEGSSYMAANRLGEKGTICQTAQCSANRFLSVEWLNESFLCLFCITIIYFCGSGFCSMFVWLSKQEHTSKPCWHCGIMWKFAENKLINHQLYLCYEKQRKQKKSFYINHAFPLDMLKCLHF